LPSYKTNSMTKITNEQRLDALERLMLGMSSGLQDLDKESESYHQLKDSIDRIYEEWRVLNLKVNPPEDFNDISDLL